MPLKNNKMTMALIFIVIIATTILAQNTSKNKNVQTKGSTLKQAISIGIIEAKKWNTSAELAQVISTDAGDQTSGIRGINGKRKIWNIIFIEPKTNEYYYVQVVNNKVVSQREVQGAPFKPIDFTDIKIDTNQALTIAKKNKNLQPGKSWCIGYHYNLMQDGDIPIIRVYGNSLEGNLSYIEINANNG